MTKNFQAQTYIVDDNLSDTLSWLCEHQECFDSFHYDAVGGRISGDIQPKGIIAAIPAFPNGLISDTDLCSHLFCFRTDDGEWSFHRLLEVEQLHLNALVHHSIYAKKFVNQSHLKAS
jgi:hypothetical protein